MTSPLYSRFYAVVQRIPKGRVATYGQIARLAGLPRHARHVGFALSALAEGSGVPWHRVVNSKGEISRRDEPLYFERQAQLLKREGIVLGRNGRIALDRFQWRSTSRRTTEKRITD